MNTQSQLSRRNKQKKPRAIPLKVGGWFAVNRHLLNHPLWLEEKFTKGQAWIDLIGLAAHEPTKVVKQNSVVYLERGQVAISKTGLEERWGWGKGGAERYLRRLQNEERIRVRSNTVYTLISVVNYDRYQFGRSAERGTNEEQNEEQIRTYNNKNKENNNNKGRGKCSLFERAWYELGHIPHFDEVLLYGQSKGYDGNAISGFYAEMQENRWRIDDEPVAYWHLVLDARMKKMHEEGLTYATAQPTMDQCKELAESHDFDPAWGEEWFMGQERADWIAGGEPVQFWELTLLGWLTKREADRTNHPR
ncbi:MAG: hypothetical protein ACPGVU_17895 [Limisphaerales bacterium]